MRTLRLTLTLTVLLALLGGSPARLLAQDAEPTPATVVDRDLGYADRGVYGLDVYAPSEPGPWPVVVITPGAFQNKAAYAFLARAIAEEGAVVFNAGVSMAEPFPEATRQVACAVRFARATAADHGGDPGHVTLLGHSAGAALGMVVAMAGDDYARDCVVTDGSAQVDALVGYEGPFDWATTDYEQINLVPLKEEDPEAWRAIDPYAHIGGNPDLVVRLVHGDDTDTAWYEVPRAVSVTFDQALLDAGYDSESILLEDADHGAMLYRGSEAVERLVELALRVSE